MKAQFLTEEVLESLPRGRYAIFINGNLHEVIYMDNESHVIGKTHYPIVAIGRNEYLTFEEYVDCVSDEPAYILPAEQIKLATYSVDENAKPAKEIALSNINSIMCTDKLYINEWNGIDIIKHDGCKILKFNQLEGTVKLVP